jgi:hypothetical protein
MKGLIKMGIEPHPIHPQRFGQKDFGVKARCTQAFSLKTLIGPTNQTEDCPWNLRQRDFLIPAI